MTTTLDNIKSNNAPFCLRCNCVITPDNDSGWEGFKSDGITTQPICQKCDRKSYSNMVLNRNKNE